MNPSLRFCRVLNLTDVFSCPPDQEGDRNALRETQALAGEVVVLLSRRGEEWAEIEKADQTRGWVSSRALKEDDHLTRSEAAAGPRQSCDEFFNSFATTPYLPGGLSMAGIDCSGLVQLYFLTVFGRLVPRNSRAQRSLIIERPKGVYENEDLVFAMEKPTESRPPRHHAGVMIGRLIWHSDARLGVVGQSLTDFEKAYTIEAAGPLQIS